MKKTRLIALALAACAAAGAASVAQAADKRLSVQVFGLVSKYSGSDAFGTIYGQVGYLFTDSIEGGVSLSQTLGATDSTGIGLFGKYYFGGAAQAKSWLPYVHAAAFRVSQTGPDATSLRAGVGVEVPLSEAASMLAEAAASRQKVSGGSSLNGSEILVGLKVRF